MEQYTLGKLISELEKITPTDSNEEIKEVRYDFAYFNPTELSSWRGDYSQLSLGYESEYNSKCLLPDLLSNLKRALLSEVSFEGYKGGTYCMNEHTRIWVAQPNESCNTGIVGVVDEGYKVILLTGYFEY